MEMHRDVDVEIDGKNYLADVEEHEIIYQHKSNGYVCKVLLKKPIEPFHGFKRVSMLGLSADFYCGSPTIIIEASRHQHPLKN